MDMDDKAFIAAYVAQEMQRVEKRLRELTTGGVEPGKAEKEELFQDIGTTLARLERALAQIPVEEMDGEPEETLKAQALCN